MIPLSHIITYLPFVNIFIVNILNINRFHDIINNKIVIIFGKYEVIFTFSLRSLNSIRSALSYAVVINYEFNKFYIITKSSIRFNIPEQMFLVDDS